MFLAIMSNTESPQEDSNSLSAFLGQLQTPTKRELTRGMRSLASLNAETIDRVAEFTVRETLSNMDVNAERLASENDIPLEASASIIPALPSLIAIVSTRAETTDELVAGMIATGILDEDVAVATSQVVKRLVAVRAELKTEMRNAQLANETLPSFASLSTAIDLRLGFKGNDIEAAVPVLLVRLYSDSDSNNDFYFQAKAADVRFIISKLNSAVKKLEAAQIWATGRASE